MPIVRTNSMTGLSSLSKGQEELLKKTDELQKLLERTTFILQQTVERLELTQAELAAERTKNKELADILDSVING